MYSFSLIVALAAGLATATPVAVPEAQAPKPSCPKWTGLNEVNGIACCVYEYSDRACVRSPFLSPWSPSRLICLAPDCIRPLPRLADTLLTMGETRGTVLAHGSPAVRQGAAVHERVVQLVQQVEHVLVVQPAQGPTPRAELHRRADQWVGLEWTSSLVRSQALGEWTFIAAWRDIFAAMCMHLPFFFSFPFIYDVTSRRPSLMGGLQRPRRLLAWTLCMDPFGSNSTTYYYSTSRSRGKDGKPAIRCHGSTPATVAPPPGPAHPAPDPQKTEGRHNIHARVALF